MFDPKTGKGKPNIKTFFYDKYGKIQVIDYSQYNGANNASARIKTDECHFRCFVRPQDLVICVSA